MSLLDSWFYRIPKRLSAQHPISRQDVVVYEALIGKPVEMQLAYPNGAARRASTYVMGQWRSFWNATPSIRPASQVPDPYKQAA